MLNQVFSDNFSRRENLFTRIDARIKIIFIIASILAVITSGAAYIGFTAGLLAVAGALCIRIPFKMIVFRLSASLGAAVMMLFIKIFLYREGLDSGFLMMSKIIGSTSLILFLSLTTSLDKLLRACLWFKVPGAWIEVCLIAYRYIFVLLEDAMVVFDAQRARLGYTNWLAAMRSIGTLAGTIVIRAYDQSIATYEAMMLRGYKGRL